MAGIGTLRALASPLSGSAAAGASMAGLDAGAAGAVWASGAIIKAITGAITRVSTRVITFAMTGAITLAFTVDFIGAITGGMRVSAICDVAAATAGPSLVA
ncbi:hypothetical protein OU995_04075 [Roseateles sp. SL47]|uniref:hypothetical protein n=1 Tax=Roseateles sp. SL47 TaxID=2995138 RepID=UPI0022710EB1|nr:hypothetical protein [Roseateles sp. SL47]WAC73921.1 hypothetical protein OU995_04075 [Roseateles sp. SL47]